MSCSSMTYPPGYWQTHSYTLEGEPGKRGGKKAGMTVMWRSAPEARLVADEVVAHLIKMFLERKRRREQEGKQPIDNTYWVVMKDQPIEDSDRTIDLKIITWPWQRKPTVTRNDA